MGPQLVAMSFLPVLRIRIRSDPNPVGSGHFCSDPDSDVWDRIRILIRFLALINDTISTFLVCVKAINTFWSMKILLEHIFIKKKFRKKVSWKFIYSRTGSGSGRFWKFDPVKNRPDPQHWLWLVMSTFCFFVNKSNSFFAFDHEKTNDSFFFTFTKLKY
jgi:hypothetical protein